jgi:aspartokinase
MLHNEQFSYELNYTNTDVFIAMCSTLSNTYEQVMRADEEKRMAERKKQEEERRIREIEEKKQRDIEEKRRRLEEAEKKRQAMMQALKVGEILNTRQICHVLNSHNVMEDIIQFNLFTYTGTETTEGAQLYHPEEGSISK